VVNYPGYNPSTRYSTLETLLLISLDLSYLNQNLLRFPGAQSSDDMINLLKLLLSKDPDSSIRTEVALSGGYELCSIEKSIDNNRKKCTESNYVWSEENLRCFFVSNVTFKLTNNFNSPCKQSLIDFQNDIDVAALINLTRSGV
jgi:hypothetical protein